MQITFDREKLLNAITCLKNITRMKSNLPVTHNLRFEVLTHSANISANDLEVGAMTLVPCESESAKVFLINAGTLAGILENIKAQAITMEVPDIIAFGNSKAIIRVGTIEVGLPLADPDDFPIVTRLEADEAFTIDAPDFIGGVARTLYASSNDESRYVLTGLNMQLKAGTFYVVGTDGFRIAIFKKTVSEGGTSPSLVVPARVAKFIKETIDEHATIEVTLEEKRAQFVTNTITIISRIIAEKFPDYESTISCAFQGLALINRRADLLAALKRMSVLAKKEDAVIIRRASDGMHLDVETSSGYAKETIECGYRDATPLALQISLKYFLDAIEHLSGEDVTILYTETYGMVRIDEDGYTVGIMPIRLNVPPLKEDHP